MTNICGDFYGQYTRQMFYLFFLYPLSSFVLATSIVIVLTFTFCLRLAFQLHAGGIRQFIDQLISRMFFSEYEI